MVEGIFERLDALRPQVESELTLRYEERSRLDSEIRRLEDLLKSLAPSVVVAAKDDHGSKDSLLKAEPKVTRQKPPQVLILPDGTQKPLRYWKDLVVEVSKYLVATSRITPEMCPISKD